MILNRSVHGFPDLYSGRKRRSKALRVTVGISHVDWESTPGGTAGIVNTVLIALIIKVITCFLQNLKSKKPKPGSLGQPSDLSHIHNSW